MEIIQKARVRKKSGLFFDQKDLIKQSRHFDRSGEI